MNVFDLSAKIAMDINGYLKGMDTAKAVAVSTMSIIGGAVSEFMDQSIEVGKKFDSSMSQVSATMGDKADKMVQYGGKMTKASQALRDFALETGRTTAFTASECAEALNYMALAGYDAGTSMEMLPNVLNLAAAGNMDLARASDMVTDTQTAFGISGSRVTKMIDEMAKASSTGNTSVEQLGDAFLTVGGLAQELNGGFVKLSDGTTRSVDGVQELEIALTAMANAGIKGSEAGTHMRNMLLKLSSPTKEGADEMERLGVKVFDADGHMRSLQDIMSDLNGSLSTLTQEEKVKAISNLFNTRDLASAEALLNAVGSDWDAIGEEILNAKGAADKMAKTQLDNLAGDTKLFESALEGLQIALSDGATPALREMTQFGTDAITDLTELFQGLPPEAQTAISLLATFGSKAMAIAPQILGLAGNIAQLKIAQTVAGNTNTLGSSLASLAGPAGIAVGAIAAVVMIYEGYKQKLEWATEAQQELLDGINNTSNVYQGTHERVQTLINDTNEYRSEAEKAAELDSMRVGIMDTHNEAVRKRTEAQLELKEVEEKLAVAANDLTVTWEYGDDQMVDYTYDTDILREQQKKLNETIEQADVVISQTNGDLVDINGALENLTATEVENTSAVEATTVAYQLFGHDISESTQNSAQNVVDSVLNMQEALSGSVKSIGDWFSEVAEIEKVKSDDMKNNLRAQIQQIKDWEKDLNFLADKGINKEFLTYLANMGPEGYKYVLAMKEDVISGGQDTVDEWNALYSEKLKLEEGINEEAENVYDSIIKMEAGGSAQFEAMAKQFNIDGAKIGEGVTLGLINKLNDALTDLEEAGKEDAAAVTDGMKDQFIMNSPSKATAEIGEYAGKGLVQGLNQQKGAIKAAGMALGKAAVEGITGQQGAVSTFGATIGKAIITGINGQKGAVQNAGMGLGQALANGLKGQQGSVQSIGVVLGQALAGGVRGQQGSASSAGATAVRAVINGANSVNPQGNGYNIGMYFVLGMRNGINDYAHYALQSARNTALQMMNSVKSIMQIGSPSKVAEYFGEMWDAGLEGGILGNAEAPISASRDMAQGVVDETSRSLMSPSYGAYSGSAESVGAVGGSPVNVTMNIYGAEGQDIRQLAVLISQEMAMMLQEDRAVWA